MNLFTDNATTHLSTANDQYWNGQEQKSSLLVSSVPSPAPATVSVANAGLSSSGRGGGGAAVNKRSRGVAAARGESKPAKAGRVARPKKPQSFPLTPVTGQYYTCEQQQQPQAPPRVVNPPLTGIQL